MSWFSRQWEAVWDAVRAALFAADPGAADTALQGTARQAAPVIWLIGKTGAGKTAIVAGLTGDPRAEIGSGYQPCTRRASFYDVPEEAPFLRFLDTRGLEEADYEPSEDIAWCEAQAHLLVVVMQVADAGQEAVLRVVRAARARHPGWPVLVAQTGLHRRYPSGFQHPDPFEEAALPEALRQSLAYQRGLFADLPGRAPPIFIPLDFTDPADGYSPILYRREALDAALEQHFPDAMAALGAGEDQRQGAGRRTIYAYAALAAAAGAVPVPLAGAAGLAGLQAAMLNQLARRHGVEWTPTMFSAFAGALGVGALGWFGMRYALAEVAKLVPGFGTAAGMALNAGSAAAFTAGTGEAALVFLRGIRLGQSAPSAEMREAYAKAFRGWRERRG